MDRKLAHIETIAEILEHKNADTLEIAKVLGWTCVVLKGKFQAGQQIVFIEPDAILAPGQPEWEFMREKGFRIKTIKLRGVISQGLCFPLSILPIPPKIHPAIPDPKIISDCSLRINYRDGDDVTAALGITKYEPYVPAELSGQVKGNFPEFLHKTDEIRIQAVPAVLYRHQNKKFYVTEKLDGSSMTVYLRWNEHVEQPEFGVCSRNLDMKETESNSFWKIARALDLENKMVTRTLHSDYPWLNFSLQGELVGPGVQKNKLNLPTLNFYIFNIFNIDKQEYLCYNDFVDVVAKMGLQTVPILTDSYVLPNTVEEVVEFSRGMSVINPSAHREGVVFRPLTEERDEDLDRLSFKCINPDFLLKHND